MNISPEAIWGLVFVGAPLTLFVIIITIACTCSHPWKWLKWIVPLIFIVPLAVNIISSGNSSACAIFEGVALAVFLYGFCHLLFIFVGALRKPKKARTSGKEKKNG